MGVGAGGGAIGSTQAQIGHLRASTRSPDGQELKSAVPSLQFCSGGHAGVGAGGGAGGSAHLQNSHPRVSRANPNGHRLTLLMRRLQSCTGKHVSSSTHLQIGHPLTRRSPSRHDRKIWRSQPTRGGQSEEIMCSNNKKIARNMRMESMEREREREREREKHQEKKTWGPCSCVCPVRTRVCVRVCAFACVLPCRGTRTRVISESKATLCTFIQEVVPFCGERDEQLCRNACRICC